MKLRKLTSQEMVGRRCADCRALTPLWRLEAMDAALTLCGKCIPKAHREFNTAMLERQKETQTEGTAE